MLHWTCRDRERIHSTQPNQPKFMLCCAEDPAGPQASDDAMLDSGTDLMDLDLDLLLPGVRGVRVGSTTRSTELEVESWLRTSLSDRLSSRHATQQ